MQSTIPVLIVGAGPAGVYLALALRKNGINVRIIEKDNVFHVGTRGAGIMPRTIELMGLLGVYDDILRYSSSIPKMRSYTPGPVEQAEVLKVWDFVDVVEPTPASPHRSVQGINQNIHEGVIREHLKILDCEVELGTEFVGFEQDDQGVNVRVRRHRDSDDEAYEETIRALYLVGADGAKGPVRKLLRLPFLGETKDADAILVADVETHNLTTDYMHFWEQSKGDGSVRVFTRPWQPNSQTCYFFNLIMLGNFSDEEMHQVTTDLDALQDQFHKVSGRIDVKFDSVPWHSYFRPNMRMVNKFGEGRVFVVGDAAHVHSPLGAQGLNSSVQDSINLAWKLSLVLKNFASPSLLDTFTEERVPVIAEMLRKTSGLYTLTYAEGKSTELAKERDAWRRGGELFMLGINYRWSSIVLEERDPSIGDERKGAAIMNEMKARSYGGYSNGLCAGDRAPEAPDLLISQVSDPARKIGEETSLFKMLSPAKHSIVIFASSQPEVIEEILRTIVRIPENNNIIQTVVIRHGSLQNENGTIDSSPKGADGDQQQDGVDMTLVDRDGHAHDAYLVKEGELTIAIIRPDGYISAITKDAKGVERYSDKIFNL